MSLLFISFYTKEYTEDAKRLRQSLDRFNLNHDIRAIPSKGTWLQNVRYKVFFMREMMKKHRDYDAICWIDADGTVEQNPALLFSVSGDIAAHFFQRRKGSEEILCGTFYVRNTEKLREGFMRTWHNLVTKAPSTFYKPEQQVFMRRMLPNLVDLKITRLPYEYCRIFDTMPWDWNENPKLRKPAVIEHHQASRRFRNKNIGQWLKEKRL